MWGPFHKVISDSNQAFSAFRLLKRSRDNTSYTENYLVSGLVVRLQLDSFSPGAAAGDQVKTIPTKCVVAYKNQHVLYGQEYQKDMLEPLGTLVI